MSVAAAVLLRPAASANDPAATAMSRLPAALASGVTTRVARLPSMRVKAPLLPPVTVTSVASKLLPTSLLKLKVSVTSPLAVLPAALLVTVATGGKVSKA